MCDIFSNTAWKPISISKDPTLGESTMKKSCLAVVSMVCVCLAIVVAYSQPKNANERLPGDPILAIGHGAIVGADGQEVELNANFIAMVQKYYIQKLLNENERRDKRLRLPGARIDESRSTIASEVDDETLANALFLDWLIEKTQPENTAQLTIANNALRWHYVGKIQKDPMLPKENVWGKGLPPDVAKQLERKLGIKILALTNAAGEAYRRECEQADVPVPNFMFGDEWRFVGEVQDEFLSSSLKAELWIHESQSPPGVCLALPRFPTGGDRAELFGVICLGTQTSKACFFDNPKGKFFQRNVRIDFKEFLGGTDLVANGQGVCSDCHAGENPYVVHPEKPAFASVISQLRPMAWHDPLVDASWPQNPGPTNQLDAVPSPGRCDSCHRVGSAGRFPEVSTLLPQYCEVVLGTAAGISSKRTMPMPVALADRNLFLDHINSLMASCSTPPSGGGVVVDVDYQEDPTVLTPPLVVDPIYQCATTVGVRGAVLDAKVTLSINGTDVDVISPVRSTHLVEFTGLAELKAGDKVTASQEKDGVVTVSAVVTVRDHTVDYPAGLPAPSIDPTLIYECAKIISIRHVPSAKVTIFTNGGNAVTRIGGSTGWTIFGPGKQPFEIGDDFTAEISLCDDPSPRSPSGVAVAVAAPKTLPPATSSPPETYSGQELVTLENLTNGSQTTIAEVAAGSLGSFSTSVSWYPDFDVATPLGRRLVVGDKLTATQMLCDIESTGEIPPTVRCDELPAPRIQHPIVGNNYVVVTQSVPGARIRVYDAADREIGDGSGTIIILTRVLTGADVLTVVQQVGDCTSKTGYRVSVRNPQGPND